MKALLSLVCTLVLSTSSNLTLMWGEFVTEGGVPLGRASGRGWPGFCSCGMEAEYVYACTRPGIGASLSQRTRETSVLLYITNGCSTSQSAPWSALGQGTQGWYACPPARRDAA